MIWLIAGGSLVGAGFVLFVVDLAVRVHYLEQQLRGRK
jgi:hypothetical protein